MKKRKVKIDDGLLEVEHDVWETENNTEFVDGKVTWSSPVIEIGPWFPRMVEEVEVMRKLLLEDAAQNPGEKQCSHVWIGSYSVVDGSDLDKDLAAMGGLISLINGYESGKDAAAFEIGLRLAGMRVRMQSRQVSRGRKVRKGAQDGHAAVHGTTEEKAARWTAYRATYTAKKATNPYLLHEDLCRHTAKEYGVSLKTIKRHCPRK